MTVLICFRCFLLFSMFVSFPKIHVFFKKKCQRLNQSETCMKSTYDHYFLIILILKSHINQAVSLILFNDFEMTDCTSGGHVACHADPPQGHGVMQAVAILNAEPIHDSTMQTSEENNCSCQREILAPLPLPNNCQALWKPFSPKTTEKCSNTRKSVILLTQPYSRKINEPIVKTLCSRLCRHF